MRRDRQFEELRQRAQERLPRQSAELPLPPEASPQRMLHELRVYQVELEMQNEHLAASRAWVEAALASYTELYDFAPVACLTFDRNGVIVEMNLAAARLLGAERAQLLDKRFTHFIAAHERRRFTAALAQLFGGRPAAARDFLLAGGDSAPRTVQMETARAADGQHCRAVLVDVSARVARETRAAHLVQAFERSDEAILVTDAFGTVIDANAAFGALCALVPSRLAGQDGRRLRVAGKADAAMWNALALDGHWRGVSAWRQGSGAEVMATEELSAVRDEQGNVVQHVSRLRQV